MEVVFALITAFAFGFDYYFIRKGLLTDPVPLSAAFITLTINFFFFVVFAFFTLAPGLFTWGNIRLFILAGVLAPGCARVLSYRGLDHLGMAIAAPIINSETLFSVFMAIIFLRERVTVPVMLGVLGVITGLSLLSYETGRRNEAGKPGKVRLHYLFYPITAAAFYGVSVFFRKLGLNATASPILGAMVTSGTSWCILLLFMIRGGKAREIRDISAGGLGYFFLGGIMTCVAWLSLFSALNIGRVSLVAPISNSYSLVTMLLSYFLLRRVESITLKTVLATMLVVGGITILIAGR